MSQKQRPLLNLVTLSLLLSLVASAPSLASHYARSQDPDVMPLSQYLRGGTTELPFRSSESSHAWMDACKEECESLSKPHPDYELEDEVVAACDKECSQMFLVELEDECTVIEIPSGTWSEKALGICTKNTCVLAPQELFPTSIDGLDLYHYRNLLAYCIKAGMDPRFVIPLVDTTDELLSQSFLYSGKKIRMYDLIDSLPELEESPLVGITRAVMRTHPDAKVWISSVSRSYLDMNQVYKRMNKFFVHYFSQWDSSPRLDHQAFASAAIIPQSPHDQEEDEGFFQHLLEIISGVYISGADSSHSPGGRVPSPDNFGGCYLNLVRHSDLSARWTISSWEDIDSHGYELITAIELPLYPPSLLFSNHYLVDVCKKVHLLRNREVESGQPLGKLALGVDLYEYTYPYNKLVYPSFLRSLVLTPHIKRVWSTPVFIHTK